METGHIQSTLFILGCLIITNLFIKYFSKLSGSVGLVDRPNLRKIHQHSIPLVGGLSMLSAITFASFLSPLIRESLQTFVIPFTAALLVFIVSVLDDRFDISVKLRLTAQITAAIAVSASGVRIESMYGMFGIYEITLGFQHIITVIVLVGSTNAFNLIDGVDGLAGTLGGVTSTLLGFIALSLGLNGISLFCFGLSAALLAFLKHNLFPAKIFMGDAGSMTLGFLFTLVGIILLQEAISAANSQLIFTVITCALMVPVIDAIRVFIKRYSKGNSILKADRTHLHHLFLNADQNHKKVVIKIVILQLSLLVVGVVLASITSITATIFTLILSQIFISKILMMNKTLVKWQQQLHQNEKLAQL